MSKDRKTTRKEQYKENRKKLIALSVAIRALVKEGEFDTVNEGLRETYMEQDTEIDRFNTFWQWKEYGYTINKGSKAYLFWGQPRKAEQVPEGSDEPEEYKYWPICYLFANTQVFKKGETTEEKTPEPQNRSYNVDELENSLM